MIRLRPLLLVLILGCGNSKGWRKVEEKYPSSSPDKPVLALIAQPARDKSVEDLTAWASDQTLTLLADADGFQVQDRSKTAALMKERGLAQSGALEGGEAVELGRLLSARRAILVAGLICRIEEVEAKPAPRKKATPVPSNRDRAEDVAEDLAFALLHGIGEGIGKGMAEALRTATVSVSLSCLDLDSGAVIKSVTVRAQGEGRGGPGALSHALGLLEGKIRRKLPDLLLAESAPLPPAPPPSQATGG